MIFHSMCWPWKGSLLAPKNCALSIFFYRNFTLPRSSKSRKKDSLATSISTWISCHPRNWGNPGKTQPVGFNFLFQTENTPKTLNTSISWYSWSVFLISDFGQFPMKASNWFQEKPWGNTWLSLRSHLGRIPPIPSISGQQEGGRVMELNVTCLTGLDYYCGRPKANKNATKSPVWLICRLDFLCANEERCACQ